MKDYEFDRYLENSPLNGTKFNQKEISQIVNSVREQINTEVGSCFNLINRLNNSEARRQNITVEQLLFNTEAQKAIDYRSATEFQNKWADFTLNRQDSAERNLKTTKLVSLMLSLLDASNYIKPTKTNLNKLLSWSSSRHAEYRKSEVTSIILSASQTPSKTPQLREFSSGSTTISGGLGGRASYRLVEALGATLLIDDLEGKSYRFEKCEDILDRLNNFKKDEELLDELSTYQDELSTLDFNLPDKKPF